jgi:hypothetical protein
VTAFTRFGLGTILVDFPVAVIVFAVADFTTCIVDVIVTPFVIFITALVKGLFRISKAPTPFHE